MPSRPRIVALLGSRAFYGAERANIDALKTLQAGGAEVVCLVREDPWPELERMRAFLDSVGLAHRPCPYPDYPNLRWLAQILWKSPMAFLRANLTLLDTCREFQATHIHGYNPFLTAVFLPALSRLPLPLVYRCGDAPTLHNAFYRFIWRNLARRISHVVADSNYIKSLAVANGIEATRIEVLYAPPPQRPPSRPFCLTEHCAAGCGLDFVFVGQITPSKGIRELLEAMLLVVQTNAHARLLVAGQIVDEFSKQTRDAATIAMPKNIAFLGNVEDVTGLLSAAHAHVAPSIRPESYGLVVVEAKKAGVPSIIFDDGGMSELVSDDENGLKIQPKTALAFAEGMLRYCQSPALARTHGAAAKLSLDRFRFDLFAQRWLEAYETATRQDMARSQAA